MKVFANNTEHENVRIKTYYKNEIVLQNIFVADKGQLLEIPSLEPSNPHMIYVGLGALEELSINDIRNLSAKAFMTARKYSKQNISFDLLTKVKMPKDEGLSAVVEGISLADFHFDGYQTSVQRGEEAEVYLSGTGSSDEEVIQRTLTLTKAMNMAKAWMLEPCNKLNPQTMVQTIRNLAEEYSLEVEILEEQDLLERGLNGLYQVGIGSVHKPRLAILRYLPQKDGERVGLIGKGITCDTGGYSLKDRNSLPYIKGDMAGAANMIATICALAKNKGTTNVVAVIPLAENKISSDSYIPGDVITSFAGKTIEVLDTDCEGRMILADALSYAVRCENATKLIDMATLTGLAGTTFGSLYTPVFSNHEEFYCDFMNANQHTNEDFWRMPLDDRYRSYLSSSIADISNKGGAGTITAAIFLQEFVEDLPWIHLDIAATAAQYPIVNDYAHDMPSAVGVRTIYQMLY